MDKKTLRTIQKIAVWVVAGLLVLLALPGAVGLVWAPGCSGCHAQQTQKLAEGVHAGQECRSCHEPQTAEGSTTSGRIGFNHRVMYSMVFRVLPTREPARAVANISCLSCHEKAINAGTISNEGLRISHPDCTGGMRCSSCHGGIGHPKSTEWQPRYAMDNCLACHEKTTVRTLTECELCHDGNMGRSSSANSTFAVVHGPDWEQSHGLGDWNTCSPCHRSSTCARCHGALVPHTDLIINQHSQVASDPNNKCGTCHRERKFCDDCHGVEMPHPSGFLKSHSQTTKNMGEDACLRCHTRVDCTNCHVGHTHPGGARP